MSERRRRGRRRGARARAWGFITHVGATVAVSRGTRDAARRRRLGLVRQPRLLFRLFALAPGLGAVPVLSERLLLEAQRDGDHGRNDEVGEVDEEELPPRHLGGELVVGQNLSQDGHERRRGVRAVRDARDADPVAALVKARNPTKKNGSWNRSSKRMNDLNQTGCHSMSGSWFVRT